MFGSVCVVRIQNGLHARRRLSCGRREERECANHRCRTEHDAAIGVHAIEDRSRRQCHLLFLVRGENEGNGRAFRPAAMVSGRGWRRVSLVLFRNGGDSRSRKPHASSKLDRDRAPVPTVNRFSLATTSFWECPSCSKSRMIGATANSRSPVRGFGSIASHGSRCAASTFWACRSW